MKCRDNRIIPKGLRLKFVFSTNNSQRIAQRTNVATVQERIKHASWIKMTVTEEITKLTQYDKEH